MDEQQIRRISALPCGCRGTATTVPVEYVRGPGLVLRPKRGPECACGAYRRVHVLDGETARKVYEWRKS